MNRHNFIDYYKVLSVEKDATNQEIKESYQLLSFRYKNRDVLPPTEEPLKRLELIEQAYQVLSDPYKKKSYDALYDSFYRNLYNDETSIPSSEPTKIIRTPIIVGFLLLTILVILALVLRWFPLVLPEDNTSEKFSPAEDDVFKVALMVPSTITDGGWSQSGYQALLDIERLLGAKITYQEVVKEDEIKAWAKYYGEENFDLIIGHGAQYSKPFKNITPAYDGSIYLTSGGNYTNNNLSAVEIQLEKVSYIAGAVAANISETGRLGCIGGADIPSVSKTLEGFRLGAQRINPDIEVDISYLSRWDDLRGGYDKALDMIDRGVDVLYANANATGLGVIQAAAERDVYVFGQDSNQSSYAPDQVIASITQNTPKIYLVLAMQIKDGNFERGEPIVVSFENEYINFIWNDVLLKKLPENILILESTIMDEFERGDLQIPGEQDMLKSQ